MFAEATPIPSQDQVRRDRLLERRASLNYDFENYPAPGAMTLAWLEKTFASVRAFDSEARARGLSAQVSDYTCAPSIPRLCFAFCALSDLLALSMLVKLQTGRDMHH